MKLKYIIITFGLLACNFKESNTNTAQIAYNTVAFKDDSILKDIQKKVKEAFVKSLVSKNTDDLATLEQKLTDLYKTQNNKLILYWQAYTIYYKAIFYINGKDKANSEKEIKRGIQIMEKMDNKNSEDYALLAYMQSFSIQFATGMKAGFISGSVKKNAKSALELSKNNLRAYYVYASNDFYTPEQYGGGKEAESYLLKAIAMPEQEKPNEYLPSWGKEESYEMLIKLYIKKEDYTSAKKYFKEAIKQYNDSYTINQLGQQLIDK